MGRANKYLTHVEPYLKDIPHWYEEMTEGQIAKRLGISIGSFEAYKKQYPELMEALRKGKQYLADELKDALRKKAKGFYYTETKTVINGGDVVIEKKERYSPPDVGAIHLLLKNIDDKWRNDDMPTFELKREELDIKKTKASEENW